MDLETANWLAVIERENQVPLFVRKSSNDIQLGKVANSESIRSTLSLCTKGAQIFCRMTTFQSQAFAIGTRLEEVVVFTWVLASLFWVSMLHNVYHFNYCRSFALAIAKRKHVTWRHFNFLFSLSCSFVRSFPGCLYLSRLLNRSCLRIKQNRYSS